MQVSIKNFAVNMEVKNSGIEFEIRDTDGTFLGDFIVTRTQIIWCKGKTAKKNGKSISWNDFIALMDSQK